MSVPESVEGAGAIPRGTRRRDIPQRSTGWAARAADAMAGAGLTPNQISVLSVVFAAFGAALLVASAHVGTPVRSIVLVAVALLLPLRLLANMLDGMLAVEKGMHSPVGDLYNEVPDRLSDVLVFAAAGYATAGVWTIGSTDVGVALGWVAALAAVLTAYVRSLGAANGTGNFFQGPMAKPARMWVMVAAALVSLAEPLTPLAEGTVFAVALVVVVAGSVATVIVRLRLVARRMTAEGESA